MYIYGSNIIKKNFDLRGILSMYDFLMLRLRASIGSDAFDGLLLHA